MGRVPTAELWTTDVPATKTRRLQPDDLELLGIYLFGPRWQSALARAIHRDPRLVRRWKGAQRQVSRSASTLIEALCRDKHEARMRRTNTSFLLMVASLEDPELKGRLLGMDLAEVLVDDRLRRAAILPAVVTVIDFAPHNRAATAQKPVKSKTVATLTANPATRAAASPAPAGSSLPAVRTPSSAALGASSRR